MTLSRTHYVSIWTRCWVSLIQLDFHCLLLVRVFYLCIYSIKVHLASPQGLRDVWPSLHFGWTFCGWWHFCAVIFSVPRRRSSRSGLISMAGIVSRVYPLEDVCLVRQQVIWDWESPGAGKQDEAGGGTQRQLHSAVRGLCERGGVQPLPERCCWQPTGLWGEPARGGGHLPLPGGWQGRAVSISRVANLATCRGWSWRFPPVSVLLIPQLFSFSSLFSVFVCGGVQEEDAEVEGVEFTTLRVFHHGVPVDGLAWSPESRLDHLPQLIRWLAFCLSKITIHINKIQLIKKYVVHLHCISSIQIYLFIFFLWWSQCIVTLEHPLNQTRCCYLIWLH